MGSHINLTVQGSTVQAGHNIALNADNEINLLAAQNTADQHSTNSSRSSSVGVSIGGPSGLGVTLAASTGRGNTDGNDLTWTNTHVDAGHQVTINAGSDTTVRGAVVTAPQITANIGGSLNIESLQDTSQFDSQQNSRSASITIGPGFIPTGGSIGASKSNINSRYASVIEQSALKAGDDGFQINVAKNTDLKGAVIASTDRAAQDGKNSLTTASLTTSDLQNKAEYKGQSFNIGAGYSTGNSGVGKDNQGNATTGGTQTPGTTLPSFNGFSATLPVAMSASGNTRSTTQSGVSTAAISITHEAQQQTLTGKDAATTITNLNRDVATDKDTVHALKPIFNEQEIKAGFEIVGALTNQVGTFLNNRAKEIDAAKETAKIKDNQADQKLEQAQQLPDGAEKTQHLQDAQTARIEAIAARQEAQDIESKWGAGGSYRQVMTAVTAAAAGNITSTSAQFVQNTLINLVQSKAAQGIKELADEYGIQEGSPAHAALHALNACIGASAQSANCGAAGMGSASASVVGALLSDTQGSTEKLSQEQKEARQALVTTLVTGIATITGNAAAANTAALIEMENNSNVKNAIKAAMNDAKDYLSTKGKQGLEKTVELLEKLEVKTLVEKQQVIARYLDEAATRGGLSEPEIAVLATLYAANQVLFPTSVLGLIPAGAGKAVGKAGELIKAGVRAEEAAKLASVEVRAATGARLATGPVLKNTQEATVAATALGYKRINETVRGQAIYKRGNSYITRDVDGHNGGAWKMANAVKDLGSKETRLGTYDLHLNKIGD